MAARSTFLARSILSISAECYVLEVINLNVIGAD